jgi:hypothetical protein
MARTVASSCSLMRAASAARAGYSARPLPGSAASASCLTAKAASSELATPSSCLALRQPPCSAASTAGRRSNTPLTLRRGGVGEREAWQLVAAWRGTGCCRHGGGGHEGSACSAHLSPAASASAVCCSSSSLSCWLAPIGSWPAATAAAATEVPQKAATCLQTAGHSRMSRDSRSAAAELGELAGAGGAASAAAAAAGAAAGARCCWRMRRSAAPQGAVAARQACGWLGALGWTRWPVGAAGAGPNRFTGRAAPLVPRSMGRVALVAPALRVVVNQRRGG